MKMMVMIMVMMMMIMMMVMMMMINTKSSAVNPTERTEGEVEAFKVRQGWKLGMIMMIIIITFLQMLIVING